MEHRWGRRCALNQALRVRTATGHVLSAHVRDISLSGAYIESSAKLPLMQAVDVEFRGGSDDCTHPVPIRAWIVRSDVRGIAVEWCEFAPQPVCALLAQMTEHRSLLDYGRRARA